MELKQYQQDVIEDVEHYIDILSTTGDCSKAYSELWNHKGYYSGENGVKSYVDTFHGVPDICLRVPTGGGKTFIACAALKKIFDGMPRINKLVLWMVPSTAILDQTIKNLKNPRHPYRERLNEDFHGQVGVYDIEELLGGRNFNPEIIQDQLTICVLSYSAARTNNVDNRRMYQQCGALYPFHKITQDQPRELGEPPTLMGVINTLSPVIILDESHNAGSALSKKMLASMNPSFLLELTATPNKDSNKISIVSAGTLKKNNMVKIPIIVYGRPNVNYVLSTTIDYRNTLEDAAIDEYKKTGRYVRPIALIQAQSELGEESITYTKIKEKLIEIGIPKEQIAVKIAEKDELKNVDLLSENCPIRYIITINALKEGWDCSFAYILSSVAKKSSKVDVEQFVGRILRQPGARRFENPILNMSYVITSSDKFKQTLESMADSLEMIGFSKKDVKETTIEDYFTEENSADDNTSIKNDDSSAYLEIDPELIKGLVGDTGNKPIGDYNPAVMNAIEKGSFRIDPELVKKMGEEYETEHKNSDNQQGGEFMKYKRKTRMNPEYMDDALSVKIPYFMYLKKSGLTGETVPALLSPEILTKGINLALMNKEIDFAQTEIDAGKWETSADGSELKYSKLTRDEIQYQQETFKEIDSKDDSAVIRMKKDLVDILDKKNGIDRANLDAFVGSIVDSMSIDTLNNCRKNLGTFSEKIWDKIQEHIKKYRIDKFRDLLKTSQLTIDYGNKKNFYQFPIEIDPREAGKVPCKKSLYEKYNEVSLMESRILGKIDGSDNVLWWHRIAPRNDGEFHLNGPINHYPDFIARTKSGTIVLIEAKGIQLNNLDTKLKIEIGAAWEYITHDPKFKYFMVFEESDNIPEGAISADKLSDYLNRL